MPYLLLTGATGQLGRYLMRDLLAHGDLELAVLVRANGRTSAKQRLEDALHCWDRQLGRFIRRPVLLEGDIALPGLGLSANDRQWAERSCNAILHNAASLTFESSDSREGEPWRSNVDGTRHVLQFAKELAIRTFFHVSTAYTCGLRSGDIFESETDLGQEFSNDYERSKVAAERLVSDASWLDVITTFRPSIIVGDSETGYTSTFHGFYAALQLARAVAGLGSPLSPGDLKFLDRLNLSGHERKNFVPIDWVSAVMSHIVRHPETHGRVYHLTSPQPTTVAVIQEVILEAIELEKERRPAVASSIATALPPGVRVEDVFRERLKLYEPYWRDEPRFDSTNTIAVAPHLPCPPIDHEQLKRMAQFALDTDFGWPKPPQVMWDFDCGLRFAEHSPESTAAGPLIATIKIGIQALGPGGGEWTWCKVSDDEWKWSRGMADEVAAIFTATTSNIQRLLSRDIEITELYERGRLVIAASSVTTAEAVEHFAELCAILASSSESASLRPFSAPR